MKLVGHAECAKSSVLALMSTDPDWGYFVVKSNVLGYNSYIVSPNPVAVSIEEIC